jgi:L-histidine N-alpha-methyltransferase
MTRSGGTITMEMLGDARGSSDMAEDVHIGLTADPKDLSPWPKYFYDAEGSQLFEEITRLPEYYQTRTERSILRGKAREIVSRTRCRELVELGSGSASKTRILLDATFDDHKLEESSVGVEEQTVRFIPVDVSESALRESGEKLLDEYVGLEISAYVGDFERLPDRLLKGVAETNTDGEPSGRLVIFLGGTIGNFAPEKRRSFLRKLRAGLSPEDHILIGFDLVKDIRTLEAAYNDSAGVTSCFNKNLLKVLNERLGADFALDRFEHRAFYDTKEARIEMWLHSTVDQEVHVADLNLEVRFGAGEGMRTEISAKFTPDSIDRMFEEAGFTLLEVYTDDQDLFGVALGKVAAYNELR